MVESIGQRGLNMFNWSKCKVISVVGNTGSGKTASCYNILNSIKDKQKYIVDHPFPQALEGTGVLNLPNINFEEVTDSVIWIDEPQLVFPKGEKKNNDALMQMCSLARQRDVTLMVSTSDTRWINRGLESYIDTWLIKNLDFNLVKQGSITQKIIKQKYHNIMPNNFRLSVNEAILYCPSQIDRPMKIDINLPSFWSDKLSQPYKYGIESMMKVFECS
jgi:hypothetical protein